MTTIKTETRNIDALTVVANVPDFAELQLERPGSAARGQGKKVI